MDGGALHRHPALLFLLWFFLGYREFVRQQTPPSDAMDVYVKAKKWMWKFAYPDGPNAHQRAAGAGRTAPCGC